MQDPISPLPAYAGHAYPARALRVVAGVALGGTLDDEDGVPGDSFRLKAPGRLATLMLAGPTAADGHQQIAAGSDFGAPGDRLRLLRMLTLIGSDGDRAEVLLAVLPDGSRLAIPLSPLSARTDYMLIAAEDPPEGIRIADIACAAFAAGTRIARADGGLCPIGDLAPGDMVLTRDSGPQPVRWIGRATLRAQGAFAPVVIRAGTLGNLADLTVSPHHRIFVYQRGDAPIGGRPELLVQARHLVNDDSVFRREGGIVDYVSLIFDHHEIVYAEGVPAESLRVDAVTLPVLPEEMSQDLAARFPGLSQARHFAADPPHTALPALRSRLVGDG